MYIYVLYVGFRMFVGLSMLASVSTIDLFEITGSLAVLPHIAATLWDEGGAVWMFYIYVRHDWAHKDAVDDDEDDVLRVVRAHHKKSLYSVFTVHRRAHF